MLKNILLLLCISSSLRAKLKTEFFDSVNSQRIKESAYSAINTYHFKIPFVIGTAAFILFDGEVSDEASRSNPLFGSQENAKVWSDGLLLSLIPLMVYTATQSTIPKADYTSQPIQRAKFVAVQSLIVVADFLLIHAIKTSSQRVRPDDSDNLSFPSGHSSVSSGLSRTIYNNVNNSHLKGSAQGKFIQGSAFTVSKLVAWGRVEAKKHHLSDVLLGNAFGAFISDFFYSLFLEAPTQIETALFITPNSQSLNLAYNF